MILKNVTFEWGVQKLFGQDFGISMKSYDTNSQVTLQKLRRKFNMTLSV